MKTTYSSIRKLMVITAAAAVAIGAAGCSRNDGKKIVIKGSTTVLPIVQKAVEDFRKETGIPASVDGSGSGNGIKAIIDGTCDIATSSREMKKEEVQSAAAKGVTTVEIPVAYDMVVPVVHPSNGIANISLNQLKGIFDGSISNWKQVGGADGPIVVVSRDTSSGTYEVWHEKVLKKADVRKEALLQASNGAVLSAVAGNPRAIGYVGFGYVNSSVKTVKVDNIEVTIDNGRSGKFPVSRKLYFYTAQGKTSAEAQKFIDYLLGDKGQATVKEKGFIPLK